MYGQQQNLRDMLTQMGGQQTPQMVDQGGGGFNTPALPATPALAPQGDSGGGGGGDMGGLLQMIMSLFGG